MSPALRGLLQVLVRRRKKMHFSTGWLHCLLWKKKRFVLAVLYALALVIHMYLHALNVIASKLT